MKVVIEINDKSEMEKLSALFKALDIHAVNVGPSGDTPISVTKGDKSINPKSLFGIWSKSPRALDEIRKDAWKKIS